MKKIERILQDFGTSIGIDWIFDSNFLRGLLFKWGNFESCIFLLEADDIPEKLTAIKIFLKFHYK
jgi:hypothetical protein